MEKSRFETLLSCYLTEAQIGLLKESLLANRDVYFYGAEGTGKSILCSIFRHNGFDRVFEPGILASGGADEPVGAFTLPKNPHGVVLLELCWNSTDGKGNSTRPRRLSSNAAILKLGSWLEDVRDA